MTITALPTPPSRNDPTNFAERGDVFLAALQTFVTEANALQADVNTKQSAAATSASGAATSATNAANSATAAATSATNASNSATAASTSATNAGNSATAAANSATAAANSATAAAASAQQASETLASKANLSGANFTGPISSTAMDSTPIGQTTPAAGSFTTVVTSGNLNSGAQVPSSDVALPSGRVFRNFGAGYGATAGSQGVLQLSGGYGNSGTVASYQIKSVYSGGANGNNSLQISRIAAFTGAETVDMTLDNSGNLGLAVTPAAWTGGYKVVEMQGGSLASSTSSEITLFSNLYRNNGLWKYRASGAGAGYYSMINGAHTWAVAGSGTAGNEATSLTTSMTLDASGNLLVGATSGSFHRIAKSVTNNAGNGILEVVGGSNATSAMFYGASNWGVNAANAAVKVGMDGVNGVSLRTGGTINASGADYAEYMRKADSCGAISKGAIVGVNAKGLLTDKWSDAVSFVIKSTDPSYVGGDTWGSEEALGVSRPVEPKFTPPPYSGAADPGEAPIAPVEPEEGASEELIAAYLEAHEHYKQAAAIYNKAKFAYDMDQAEYAARVEIAEKIFKEETYPTFLQELETFQAALESARQKVDRIAFSGQVPVNVLGAVPGQYVVPVQDGDGIAGMLVNDADITFEQYRRAVGIVQNILDDERANVRVKVV